MGKKNILSFMTNKYALDTECFITRSCSAHDEIIIEIQYFQYTNYNAVINLVILGGDVQECAKNNKSIYRLGIIRHGDIFVQKNDQYCKAKDGYKLKEYPLWLKIIRNNNIVLAYISYNSEEWFLISEEQIDDVFSDNDLRIGINSNSGENQYYNWLYLNYMQLNYNDSDVMV